LPFRAVAAALEVIPKTLAQNCGVDVVRSITELRAKHQDPSGKFFGIEGHTGKISDMQALHIWEPIAVRIQVIRTAIESACMLLRIDDVVSGIKKKEKAKGGMQTADGGPDETFGDARDG